MLGKNRLLFSTTKQKKSRPPLKRTTSQDLGNLIENNDLSIDFKNKELLGTGAQALVYKVPVHYTNPFSKAQEKRYCTLKQFNNTKNGTIEHRSNEEALNKQLTSMDTSSEQHNIIKLIAHVKEGNEHFSLYPYCELILDQVKARHIESPGDKNKTAQYQLAFCINLGLDILKALDHMHRKNITHGDIKPENIGYHLNHWCLFDLGLARDLTNTNTKKSLQGTPYYLHPKSFNDESFCGSKNNDIYALGKILKQFFSISVEAAPQNAQAQWQYMISQSEIYDRAAKNFTETVISLEKACQMRDPVETFEMIVNRMTSLNENAQPSVKALIAVFSKLKNEFCKSNNIEGSGEFESLLKTLHGKLKTRLPSAPNSESSSKNPSPRHTPVPFFDTERPKTNNLDQSLKLGFNKP